MEIILIIFWILIAVSVIWTLLIGVNAIGIAWKASRLLNSSSVFYPILNKSLEGNLITILVIYVISFPVWILLSLFIAGSSKNNAENTETISIPNNVETIEVNPLDFSGFNYWYVDNQNSIGPLNYNDILKVSLHNDTLIYRSDKSDWKPLNEFEELL